MAVPLHLPGLIDRALARAMEQIDAVLTRAAATGQDAREVASRIAKFLSPHFAPRRTATGERVRADRPGGGGAWPAAPGMAFAGVRAIAETEIAKAHGNTATVIAQRTPGLGIRWLLAPGHEDADACDANASRDTGFGRGVYLPTEVPAYPSHPRCRCVLATVALR